MDTMKLNQMSKKWLSKYLSVILDVSGKESKSQLLNVCKLMGVSETISLETFNRINRAL